jgi:acyl carrier protein
VDGGGEASRPATVPIGRPISGDYAWVLDEFGALAGIGAPGRLHIGGAGVAQGYVGAPELTAERFLADPFAPGPQARMYDTGDRVRWLPDGTLEFLGRVDEQIKIRGYRVEPAEVESALRGHDGVRDAVVLARPGAGGDTRLVAYVAADRSIDIAALKAGLAGWLPEFMIPSAIVVLDALPVTPSGKVDRLALPDPDEAADAAGYVAPSTPVEEAVAEIWGDVLELERVGVEDDFFALGGHSLLATQVVAQVRSDLAVELPLHSLFAFPTVRSLAAEIVAMMSASDGEETAKLMAELDGLTDAEAERLLAGDRQPPEA